MSAEKEFNKKYPRDDMSQNWVMEYEHYKRDMINFAEDYHKSKVDAISDELKKENKEILHKYPNLAVQFDWSGNAYRLQFNEEIIEKLKE